ncbi:MAG: SDR family NAD(P)-dependent oxidoreductase [Sphingomonas sp.]|jgi:3-oxoacyl-[acyl-carrier protein] reductase|uniref:SDR family NAD(P)-dependent oxidoreductase n=1 Tax=Sphingomonas sp. TaxID=28214 RepID=UPI003568A22B
MASSRTVIVTGASRGIGRATAIRLASDFDLVVPVARTEADLEETATQIRAIGATALPIAQDMRDRDAAVKVISQTLAASERIDAIVNIAGAVPQADVLEMTDAQWEDGLALKFHGARRLAIAGWPHLMASAGSLIFMSGATAEAPKAMLAGVSAINAAISGLSKAFADRGLTDNVQVNTILPGAVLTGRRLKMIEHFAATRKIPLEDAMSTYASEAGISRFGRPEDIAALIAFALSPSAHWMTGASLRMDGGETRSL